MSILRKFIIVTFLFIGVSSINSNAQSISDSSNTTDDSRKSNFTNHADVNNRSLVNLPTPPSTLQEEGIIIVNIKVNRKGDVTWAKSGAIGTTITDLKLNKKAE
ncbi:MAG: hypothetical protein HRT71_00920 [Flavobacteriales bacterium]|nr:hypothetical protein [Flavobacteriales bacterium]